MLEHIWAPSAVTCFHLKAWEPKPPSSASAMAVTVSLQLCRACSLCCGDWWILEIHCDLAIRINGRPVGNPRASVTLPPSQPHHKSHVANAFLWSGISSLFSLAHVQLFCPLSVLHQQIHRSAILVVSTLWGSGTTGPCKVALLFLVSFICCSSISDLDYYKFIFSVLPASLQNHGGKNTGLGGAEDSLTAFFSLNSGQCAVTLQTQSTLSRTEQNKQELMFKAQTENSRCKVGSATEKCKKKENLK